ncbi:HNH endonuclease [Lysinibacillus fusiformis]|uniref:HNH endonuclease n=1 Tax=Lysinibacillus fusiformis TaxID=28031 RepID=UPI003D092E69
MVCNFNFKRFFGEIGKEFIHVHYEIEISTIGEDYEINPITDLKPICPNCHAMLHKRKPAYLIDELREIAGFSVRESIYIKFPCFKKLTI